MISINTNISQVAESLRIKLSALADKDKVMRAVAVGMKTQVHYRVHTEGKDAADGQIGTYSDGYMKVRTGTFESPTIVRGKNKGKPRPMYNRTGDTKVIASLTRQMENDMKVVATSDGYGIGYSNDLNFAKVGYLENTYKKEIFNLTPSEKEMAVAIAEEETGKIMNE